MPADRRRRRRRPGALTRERITEVALAMLDERGLAAVTMRALAQQLGVEAMSIYRYFDSRDKLLDAVVAHVVDELDDDPDVQQQVTDGWRPYLTGMARGVRRYGRRHPHAFPLLATRPSEAPWLNPPLRSVRWVETFLTALLDAGFTDDQTLFAYRAFNTFLLGYLELETSAMILADPRPGDGSFRPAPAGEDADPVATDAPVPGALTPTRSTSERRDIVAAETAREVIDPQDTLDAEQYPTIHRLAHELAEDMWDAEFAAALEHMLGRISDFLGESR